MEKYTYQPITLPSPTMSLVSGVEGVWAGGVGGVAAYTPKSGWQPCISGLPVTGVAALAYAGGWLLAGGIEGISRSADQGLHWELSHLGTGSPVVTAIVASPHFETDTSALAGTLGGGILRTENAGERWDESNFGLQDFEVTALAWGAGDMVLAGTANGIYQSPNGGRAWRLAGGNDAAIAAIVWLSDAVALAALEAGGWLKSADSGKSWSGFDCDFPDEIEVTALQVGRGDGALLAGTAENGAFRSADNGSSWLKVADGAILSFTGNEDALYMGTARGVLTSNDGGLHWTALPVSPLHDLRHLLISDGQVFVYGRYSAMMRAPMATSDDRRWQSLPHAPLPLNALVAANSRLFASGPDGLICSDDSGDSWQLLVEGLPGHFSHLSFRNDGAGWASSADHAHLSRTGDAGQTWQTSASPFGVLPLVALQAAPGQVIAATYDPRQNHALFWRSIDDGETWKRGMGTHTPFPMVATYDAPPLIGMGNAIFIRKDDGHWGGVKMEGAGIVRRIVGDESRLVALTSQAMMQSLDHGETWNVLESLDLPGNQVMDIALAAGTLYILHVGGQVSAVAL